MNARIRSLGIALAASVALPSSGFAAEPDDPAFTPNTKSHSPAIDWVEAMLEGIERNPPAPTATTWRTHRHAGRRPRCTDLLA